MAKPTFTTDLIPNNTIIEVLAIDKLGKVVKKKMTFSEWKSIKRKKGFIYKAYQLGFSQFN